MASNAFTNTYSRVWFQEGGAGPSRPVTYHGNWKAGSVSWDRGDLTIIREPDPNAYNKFIRVGRYRGEPGDPELPIMSRYTFQRSALLKVAREDCEHTLQVHMGVCENPQDFPRGWQKALILEGAAVNSYGTEDLGAMSPDENAPVNEEVPFVGSDLYEVTRLTFAEQNGDVITREITSVYVCDAAQCGACGVATDGCQVVLALEAPVAASPGTASRIFYTTNGGGSWGVVNGPPLASGLTLDLFCVGDVAVVFGESMDSVYYTDLSDLTLGVVNWTNVTTGFVATKGALAAYSLGASENWIAAEGGYIYFSDDITLGVTVSSAGGASTNDLNAIHASDSLNVVAVGAANTVVRTTNGGISWSLVTGPAVGVVLNSVWMFSALEWLVGTAGGRLFYTVNGGATWTEKGFAGNGVGAVRDIKFATPSVGYMAHNTATAGRILRTINGGYSWYVMPEGTGSIPANQRVNVLALCQDPNIVYGGGLGVGTDGFLVKAA